MKVIEASVLSLLVAIAFDLEASYFPLFWLYWLLYCRLYCNTTFNSPLGLGGEVLSFLFDFLCDLFVFYFLTLKGFGSPALMPWDLKFQGREIFSICASFQPSLEDGDGLLFWLTKMIGLN